MSTRCPVVTRGVAIVVVLWAVGLAAPASGVAARLVGGPTQRAIARVFSVERSHRGQVIVSTRVSTVSSTWAVVRSVIPAVTGHILTGATPPQRSTYYHLIGGRPRPAPPPRAVKADLSRAFRVEVVYSGSGREAINYQQSYGSACAGYGGFVDTESDVVSPMRWSVRYVVNLDDLLAAVRGPGGTTLLPAISFDATGSHVTASETVSRSAQDFGCNGRATTFKCTTTFRAGGPDPGGQLSFPAGSGLEAGVPMAARGRGACDPDNFTLGPSMWDGGGATAIAGPLRLLGGTLPSRPYAPVKVTWPTSSAQQAQGFAPSPCQGDTAVCTDVFQWQGTVSLHAIPG